MTDPLLTTTVLSDAFDRVHELVGTVVEGLDADSLLWRPDAKANSIAWLVWHLSRVQDDHVTGLGDAAGNGEAEQVWTSAGWSSRFALPYPVEVIGYGQSIADVDAFVLTEPAVLTGYHEDVHTMTVAALGAMTEQNYRRVVDEHWDPPVTAAARLVSVLNDIGQHVGQAAYVRGLRERLVG